MRIRVPFDQIESMHLRLNEIDNLLANNRSTLKKAWSSITLESQAKNSINAMLGQSNSLVGRIQASDLEMSRYLQQVIRDFREADSRGESITKNMFESVIKSSKDSATAYQDRSHDLRTLSAALGILVPVALLYPAINALGWVKERTLSRNYASSVSSNKELNNQRTDRRTNHNKVDKQYEQRKDILRERIKASKRFTEKVDYRTELAKANLTLSILIQLMASFLLPFGFNPREAERFIRRNYYEAVDLSNTLRELSLQSLKMAEDALSTGNLEAAEYYYNKYISYNQSYLDAIEEANKILLGDIDATKRVAQIVFNTCHFAGKVVGSLALGPKGGLAVDYIFMSIDYGVNVHANGFDNVNHSEYAINAAKSAATTAIFSMVPIPEFDGKTFSEIAENLTSEMFEETLKKVMHSEQAIVIVNNFLAEFLMDGAGRITQDMMP